MLVLPVLFLLFGVLCDAVEEESVHTYEIQDRSTGQKLICDKCPPGTHMAAHCTATTPTQCAPCKDEHFTELWNYLPRCLYCSNFCFENQEVEEECSATGNRVCRCKEGFFSSDDFCIRHSECEPGHGVTIQGTSHMNTVCEQCAEGSFSSSRSALESCVNHQQCADGHLVLLNGSIYHDTMCGTCEDLASGGDTYRTFLSAFFSTHRMRVTKMKRFVSRYTHKFGEKRRTRGTGLPRQRGPLLQQIKAWLADAPEQQLKRLPEMLRTAQLKIMADKLQTTLRRIEQQSPNCTLV